MNEQSNIYLPHLMVIEKITHEAPGVKTFRLSLVNTRCLVRGSQPFVLLHRLLVKDISSALSVRQDG